MSLEKYKATVVGAGLAGCEAAWRLANSGVNVTLIEMKPEKRTPAHSSDGFAELVCSNSLRSDTLENAVGLLKAEMRMLGSLTLTAAEKARVPAGSALAVDRKLFSSFITERIKGHPGIRIECYEATRLPDGPAIVATGPLTSGALAEDIAFLAKSLYFFDAAAPIVAADSLDHSRIFSGSRYGKGDDYLNCPMDEARYFEFVKALAGAEQVALKEFEGAEVFEGCMPVEVMAKRGEMTLAFGPLRPIGLTDPGTGKRPFAVVQLRREDQLGGSYNLVGFQTNLKFNEQRRVFSMIPGLENARFLRFGVMHRNTFLQSPGFLGSDQSALTRPGLYFAGQLTGVEGYVESAASGIVAALQLSRSLSGKAPVEFPTSTATGALMHYVANYSGDYQPMHSNFGLIDPAPGRIRNKRERYQYISRRALEDMKTALESAGETVYEGR